MPLEPITLNVDPTYREYRWAAMLIHPNWKWRRTCSYFAAMALFVVGFLGLASGQMPLSTGLLLIGISIFFFAYQTHFASKQFQKGWESYRRAFGSALIRLDDSSVYTETRLRRSTASWEMFDHYLEDKYLFFLGSPGGSGLIIPKRCVQGPHTIEELRTLLQSKLPQKNNKRTLPPSNLTNSTQPANVKS